MSAHSKTVDPDSPSLSLPESGFWARLPIAAGAVGAISLVASFVLGRGHQGELAFSYLTAYMYWVTIALGGLFFVVLHYLARSGWSVVIRRLAEHVMMTLPLFAVLFIPIALNLHEIFHWTHEDAIAADPLLQHKQAYLNGGDFFTRAAVYFIAWTLLAIYFRRLSIRQDAAQDLVAQRRAQTLSAPAMVVFGVTLNFAAVDWVMSLEPHWFSTIFGVYIFAGCVVSIMAFLLLVIMQLQRAGRMTVVTMEHFHDLGKLLFGFVVFWAYIGFSQFMLIWYANIPEETLFFDRRWQFGWEHISIALAAGHFVIPFFFLISQPVKKNKIAMTIATLWVLAMHYLDMYWLVAPTHSESPHFTLIDFTCWAGIGGLFIAVFAGLMQGQKLVPIGDPRLSESLAFEN